MRTLRTVPSVLRAVQEKQMPIRQPNSGREPGGLGLLEQGAPVLARVTPERAKRDRRRRRAPVAGRAAA